MRPGWIVFWVIVVFIVAPAAAASIVHAIGPAITNAINAFTSAFAHH